MSQGSRAERIGEQIRMELGELLSRGLKDPGIGFTTVTHVGVSPDLQHAKIYYTCLGDQKARRETERALRRALPFLRRELGRRLRLRQVPELDVAFDESIERQDRIERLLRELNLPAAVEHDAGNDDDTES